MSSKSVDNIEDNGCDWNDTEIKDEENTSLTVKQIKCLLKNRGEINKNIIGNKLDLIRLLKTKHNVQLNIPFQTLSVKQLYCELSLRRLKTSNAKKEILIARLNGDTNRQKVLSKPNWIKMEYIDNHIIASELIVINNSEFYTKKEDGIYKYNAISNQWIEWIKYPNDRTFGYDNIDFISTAIDTDNGFVYIYFDEWTLCKININTKQIDSVKIDVVDNEYEYGCGDKLYFIKELQELHLLKFVNDSIQHFIFNDKTQQFDRQKSLQFKTDDYYWCRITTYIPSRHMILMLTYSRIYKYCTISKQWIEICTHSEKISADGIDGCCFAVTLSQKETQQQYMILCSQWAQEDEDRINVLNLNTMKFMKSTLKLPAFIDVCSSFVTKDESKDNLTVFGFVRDSWKSKDFESLQFPPDYIIRVILTKYCNEYYHIWCHHDNEHWKISIDHILERMLT